MACVAVTAQRGTVECQAHLLTYSNRPRVSLVKALKGMCACIFYIPSHSRSKAVSSPMQLMTGRLKDMHNFLSPTVIAAIQPNGQSGF